MTGEAYDALIECLRQLRERVDMSQVSAGREVGWGSLKVWRIENLKTRMTKPDLMDLLRVYEVEPDSGTWDEYMRMYDNATVERKEQ